MQTIRFRPLILGVAILSYVAVPLTTAQDGADAPAVFMQVNCMKSLNDNYSDIETEMWQPMHQAMVDAGQKMGWAFYWVMYGDRSQCDYYTVDVYQGADQLNASVNYGDVFAKVHPGKNVDEAMAHTSASREMVRTELWLMTDGMLPTEFTYAHVTQMDVSDWPEYTRIETEIFAPIRNARVEAGVQQAWTNLRLISPGGDAVPYNAAGVTFANEFPLRWGQGIWGKVHPGMSAPEARAARRETRSVHQSATWVKIARTTAM